MSQPSTTSPPSARTSSPLAWIAFAVGALWVSSLLIMVLTTANPVTINIVQVHESTSIVVAKVNSLYPGEIEVMEVLSGPNPGKTLAIRNLTETPAQVGGTYLIPLIPVTEAPKRMPNLFDITPTGIPGKMAESRGMPLIYPDTREAREMLSLSIGK